MSIGIEALRQTAVFGSLDEASLEVLAGRFRRRRYDAGAVVFAEGDPGTGLLVLTEGEVRISVESPTGEEIILNLLRPGDAFGELALLDGLPRSATAVAQIDSQVLTLHRDDFLAALHANPAITQAILGSLASMIRRMNEKLVDVAMLDVSGRMAKAFLELADRWGRPVGNAVHLMRPVSVEELAALTGLYRAEVTRQLARYDVDVLRVEDGRYVLQDLDRWRAWARRP